MSKFPSEYFSVMDAGRELSDADSIFFADLLKRFAKSPAVLDYGCGGGWLTFELAKLGYRATGFDHSDDAIQHARRISPKAPAICFETNIERVAPLDTRPFDVIVLWNTTLGIESTDDALGMLQDSYRLLDHGGLLVADIPNIFRILPQYQKYELHQNEQIRILDKNTYCATSGCMRKIRSIDQVGTQTIEMDYRIRLFSPTEILELVKSVGFRNVVLKGHDWSDFELDTLRLRVMASK